MTRAGPDRYPVRGLIRPRMAGHPSISSCLSAKSVRLRTGSPVLGQPSCTCVASGLGLAGADLPGRTGLWVS